jgi:hypothetical protein
VSAAYWASIWIPHTSFIIYWCWTNFVVTARSTIRDKIIPHAVSWFTGEAQDEDYDDTILEDDENNSDEDDDEDDDEDEDGEWRLWHMEASL